MLCRLLSLLQLGLEAAVLRNASLITGNPVKLLLALVSVVYDAVLIRQHLLYTRSHRTKQTSEADELVQHQQPPLQDA